MTEERIFAQMIQVMYDTRKNKRYGRDSMEFERNWTPLLLRMTRELMRREFRIRHNYAFLTSVPKWREIFATEFAGRIADHLLCDTLSPYIEKELHPRTFNNRIGKGCQAAINQVIEDVYEVSRGYTSEAWIIKWDMKGFFPNADCDEMERCFCRLIDKYTAEISNTYNEDTPAFLKWLAMICVHSCPAQHCELRTPRRFWSEHIDPRKSLFDKPTGIGAPIGRMASQVAMGLYINDEVRWLNDECLIPTTVFMDDGLMAIHGDRKEYALSIIPELRKRLSAKHITMNTKKFYCQPYGHGVEFLGTHIHPYRNILNDGTYRRAISRIDEYNRLSETDKYNSIDKFLSSVNSYIGLLKNRTSRKRIEYLRQSIGAD